MATARHVEGAITVDTTAASEALGRTAHGLRRDVILDQMQADHDQAGHATGDVRDCPVCLRRYGLDGPAGPHVGDAPRSWWAGQEPADGLDPDSELPAPDDTELEEMG